MELFRFLSHFICDDCIDEVLRILFNLKTEHYYAQMGIAWAVSICYIKYPDLTLNYLKDSTLDDFCHNKSISKIIESYRVSKEDKENLKLLKRPRHKRIIRDVKDLYFWFKKHLFLLKIHTRNNFVYTYCYRRQFLGYIKTVIFLEVKIYKFNSAANSFCCLKSFFKNIF